ncbi:hypothetical protein BB934_13790 [Microvirga ossetica]|uniref:Secreted protein n=1 Tax=Microvirga ossetica TaxID=1882682 RepID=A0A1B2EH17_9HYPH|nr:hypothetical protein [Microvirga ossetica]ANY79152.1 hypothetical protein BB934_13790 [Microvirga ossetica]
MMKKATWLLAAALLGSGIVVSTPSSAQVQFGIGPVGPSVRVGPDNDRYERRYIERRRVNDRDDLSTGSIDRCRTVVIREEEPNGDIVTRRVRRCR